MMVMVDEPTGNRYMRSVDRRGLGSESDNSWLVKDMRQQLKCWGRPGGPSMLSSRRATARPLSLRYARPLPDAMGD